VTFLGGLFIIILAGMGLAAVAEVAKAIGRRGPSTSGLAPLSDRVDRLTAEIEELQAAHAAQATEVAELQERLDFAERLLAQARERVALQAPRE
jgi:predicted  nucleic acid-binding Zn-ribbon protein